MELLDVIKNRRSIRKFKADEVPQNKIITLLESARLAPSGTNRQPSRFFIAKSKQKRKELVEAASNQMWMHTAPVIIVCCADLESYLRRNVKTRVEELIDVGAFEDFKQVRDYTETAPDTQEKLKDIVPFAMFNVGIAIEHMVLTATDLGLGSCWVQLIDRARIIEICNLPSNLFVVALLVVGYPEQDPKPRPRLPLDKIYLGDI